MTQTQRALGSTILLTLISAGCSESLPPPPSEAQALVAPSPVAQQPLVLPEGAVALDWRFTLESIGPGDLDGDGRIDLTMTAHVESRVETYYQRDDRQFSASGPLQNPGFHPNGTLTLVGGDGQRYLALNAETANAVRTYRAVPDAPGTFVGDAAARAPTESIALTWPEWGQTLAVTPKWGAQVQLLSGFDPARPAEAAHLTVVPTERTHYQVAGLVAADLRGQGDPAVLVAVPREGRLVAISPAGPGRVKMDQIWDFGLGTDPESILPVDFNGDGHQDLFVLGQLMRDAALLTNDGAGGFTLTPFPVADPALQQGMRGGALTLEADDGSLLLWAGGEGTLVVLRWGKDRNVPPERFAFQRSGKDPIRFVSADLDGDGHQDLVMGSAVGSLPLTAFYGPLSPMLDGIGAWLAALKARSDAAEQAAKATRPVRTPTPIPAPAVR